MKNKHSLVSLIGAAVLTAIGSQVLSSVCVQATGTGSLLSVTEEAQVVPIPDESGCYLLKSDGFYCLNSDGMLHNTPCVHVFDNFEIDGSVFDGYYYHDESGKFRAESPHMVQISNLQVSAAQVSAADGADNLSQSDTQVFDGFYMVNNLGKLSAAPQVRYLTGLTLGNVTFEGYYYFDGNGRLDTDAQVHPVSMTCNGRSFDGYYYFGGPNGALVTESMVTADGFLVDGEGRLDDLDDAGIDSLDASLNTLLAGLEGQWSVYVKDLNTDEEILINNQQIYSASLIKAFVLAATYENLDQVWADETARLNVTSDNPAVEQKIDELLWNMITISDNESFNEMVRLQTASGDFKEGAVSVNEYLEKEGYEDTTVQNTLLPSNSASEGLGGRNMTSVKDCGLLLERIYRGECVSEEASQWMLDLFLNQQVTWKIPEGLKNVAGDITVANKTGETDDNQHDMAIVYGENTTYILCVMSEGCEENTAINNIRTISRMVYQYLNLLDTE